MHYGLLPRANRGIFAINELPDLAGKIQVGLFNILQEGDVQIKGYPVRLRLDVLMAFTANPEDYTARGKIITPLKDRIGSEIRTHYAATRALAMDITAQEAWLDRARRHRRLEVPSWVREVVEEIAFQARPTPHRQALGRQPAPADQRPRECRQQRRAAGPHAPARRRRWRASRTSTRRCRPSPASSSSSTKASCKGADAIAQRADSRRRCQRVRRLARRARHLAHRGVVRRRRHAAARGHDARRRLSCAGAPHPRPARGRAVRRASTTRRRHRARLGGGVHPRRAGGDQEDRAHQRPWYQAAENPRHAARRGARSRRSTTCRRWRGGRRSTTTDSNASDRVQDEVGTSTRRGSCSRVVRARGLAS